MTERPPVEDADPPAAAPRPSIADVAAWLRRTAEDNEGAGELGATTAEATPNSDPPSPTGAATATDGVASPAEAVTAPDSATPSDIAAETDDPAVPIDASEPVTQAMEQVSIVEDTPDDVSRGGDPSSTVEAAGPEATVLTDDAGSPAASVDPPENPSPDPPVKAPTSLFELALADLAARARASAARDAPTTDDAAPIPVAVPDITKLHRDEPALAVAPVETEVETQDYGDEQSAAESPSDDSGLDDLWGSVGVETPAPADDVELHVAQPAKPATRGPSRSKRTHYQRGQLKERIGILRRIRALLGVVVITVVLGLAAGAAIGTFLLVVAFAFRNAITSK